MADRWPSEVVARTEIRQFTGGALTERYCANLDSAKKGIKGRFRIGRKICYPVSNVIDFLENRLRPVGAQ